jgi:Holliday junction resolvase RusA-like endonuclease
MKPISFFVSGKPVPQPRPRITVRGRHGVAYVPKGHPIHAWRAKVRERMLEMVDPEILPFGNVGLHVTMIFHMVKPKSNKHRLPIGKPDIDNLAKAVLDAGNGVIWRDDSQVTDLCARKRWAEIDGVWLDISEAMTNRQMRLWLRRAEVWESWKLPGGEVYAWAMVRVHQLGGKAKAARVCGISKQRMQHYITGHVAWPNEILKRLEEAN